MGLVLVVLVLFVLLWFSKQIKIHLLLLNVKEIIQDFLLHFS